MKTENTKSEGPQIFAMFAFNCGVLVFVGGAPFGPPLLITGLLIILAASVMLIRIQHSVGLDDGTVGPAVPKGMCISQRKMRLKNARLRAISRASKHLSTVADVPIAGYRRWNSRQPIQQAAVTEIEALKVHHGQPHNGDNPAVMAARLVAIGEML